MDKVKRIKTALSITWWILVVLLAILLVNVIGAKLRGEVPSLFGYSVLRIVSGSMEPEIPIGSYIFVKEIDPADVDEGQIISFYSEDPKIYGMPNTHRVLKIETDENGLIEFVTKGDASPSDADPVNAKAEKLIGVYMGQASLLDALSNMLSGSGMFVLMLILQIATFTVIVLTVVKKKASSERGGKNN